MKKVYWIALVVGMISCSPTLPTYEVKFSGNTIDVPVQGFVNSTYNVVTDPTNPYDILLVKDSPGAYHAVYLQCTYDQKGLDPTPSEIVCPVCASTYHFDGTVNNGPADKSLTQFNTELNPDQTLVKINIEALGR